MRLNRFLASCGVSSRRGADELISQGKVTVNGAVVTELGTQIDEATDIVSIGGKTVTPDTGRVYIMLNKPAGVLSSCSDDRGRKTVLDIVKTDKRIFPVGRLDYDTQGLLILTNDGDFAYRCTHPKHEVDKTYVADVTGLLDDKALRSLKNGVVVDGRKTAKAQIKVIERKDDTARLEVTIHEGRNRQIKKMFESVGCKVLYLKRISIGALMLKDLPAGKWRHLSSSELKLLGIDDMSAK